MCGLRRRGPQASLSLDMWALPQPGVRPMSAAFTGGFTAGNPEFSVLAVVITKDA